MCGTCGCGRGEPDAHGGADAHGEALSHEHADARVAERERSETRRIAVERSLLEDNALRAERLRQHLAARGIEALGLLGGPGAGKTTLLEATLARLGHAARDEAVVEGDCATDLDARRVAALGARVIQVATGNLCHLDAHLVESALARLDLGGVARVWIENVGNLVCPAPFACGESRRALVVSVADGDDKPAKHAATVNAADVLVLSKLDLLPYVDFDVERAVAAAREVRPDLPVIALSARTGEGLDAWLDWVRGARSAPDARVAGAPRAG